jgi:hypothetical protein
MATAVPAESTGSRLGSLTTVGKVRFGLFTLAALTLLGLNVLLVPSSALTRVVLGFVQEFGVHQIHDMVGSAIVWLAFVVPLALLLYHPKERVNTVLVPIMVTGPVAVLGYLSDSPLVMAYAIVSVLALVVVGLHPAGRSLVQFDRVETVDRRLAGLFAVGAVPLLVYAGVEVLMQLGPVDEHVVFVHYGAMAIAAFLVVFMGAMAVFRQRDWRFATWFAGLMAAYIGLASIAYPTNPSSFGLVGGALLFLWAVAFVAGVEYVRRVDADSEVDASDDSVARPA